MFGFCVFDSRKDRSPDAFLKRKSLWISEIFAENTILYYKKATQLDGFIFITFVGSILQTTCSETKSNTVCYTATSWFSMVSASCTIDPTET